MKHVALCNVLTQRTSLQASSREEAAGSSSQSHSDSGTAAGASSAASESTGTVERVTLNPLLKSLVKELFQR